jgi:hypothetical protein
MSEDIRLAVARPLSFVQTVKAVAWSFVGLRQGAGYQQDAQKLNPLYVIIAGIAAAALFVLAIVLLVQWVVSSGVAG